MRWERQRAKYRCRIAISAWFSFSCPGFVSFKNSDSRAVLTSSLTHDLEETIAFNNGSGQFSGCVQDTFVYNSQRERRLKQLSTTPLNSVSRGQTWQRPSLETRHVHNLSCGYQRGCGITTFHGPCIDARALLVCWYFEPSGPQG